MLIGDGNLGKSYVALHLAMCVAIGRDFLGRKVQSGRALFIDYELSADDLKRRTWKVAEGLDTDIAGPELKERLYYYSPISSLGSRARGKDMKTITEVISEVGADFVVVDSFTMGAQGDVKDQSDIIPIVQEIREWPTTLAIDHVSHSTAKQNTPGARAFGSVFKRNAARSSLTLTKKSGNRRMLSQEKSNFSRGSEGIIFDMHFGEEDQNVMALRYKGSPDVKQRGKESPQANRSEIQITLEAVKEIEAASEGPVSAKKVKEHRESHQEMSSRSENTIENDFTKLKQAGSVTRTRGKGVTSAPDATSA